MTGQHTPPLPSHFLTVPYRPSSGALPPYQHGAIVTGMNAIAAIHDETVSVPLKTKRIPRRIAEVVNLLVTGECTTIKAASERCSMHPNYVSGALKKPEIQVFIARRARETIAAGTMRASARLIQLLDASSEHVSLDATKHTLAIAGIKPATDAQLTVNIDIKAGYVIDISDTAPQPMKVVQDVKSELP